MGSEQMTFREPTAEEYREIMSKRTRSDRISKLMAEYMLKGYRMLATYCPECSNVLLGDKSGKNYCVACEEVDKVRGETASVEKSDVASTNQKSRLANLEAPSKKVRFEDDLNSNLNDTDKIDITFLGSNEYDRLNGDSREGSTKSQNSQEGIFGRILSDNDTHSRILCRALGMVTIAMGNATDKLREKNERKIVDQACIDYVNAIKVCADALHALKNV